MTLGDALRTDRSRNLDLLRHLLAVAVIVSHAWPLALGPGTPEPFEEMTGRALGGWAVGVFFFISGLLIAASADRRGVLAFWTARARRLIPGLFVALLVTLALAMVSGSSADVAEATAWLFRAITLVSIEHRLTGAFDANPYPGVVNGPLWSLFHEVAAYAICAALVWSGLLRAPRALVAALVLTAGLSLFHEAFPGRLATFAPLFFAFSLGMAAHAARFRIGLNAVSALLCLPALVLLPWTLSGGLAGLVLVILFLRAPSARLSADASYGLYIYGWPLAQAVVAILPGIGPFQLAVLSVLVAYPAALASWHFVERPALRAGRVWA